MVCQHYCWLCGGWSEQQLRCRLKRPDSKRVAGLRIHLLCDGWRARLVDDMDEVRRLAPQTRALRAFPLRIAGALPHVPFNVTFGRHV